MNHANAEQVTALNAACYDKHEACAILLLQNGADPDVTDQFGDTPRSLANDNNLTQVLAAM